MLLSKRMQSMRVIQVLICLGGAFAWPRFRALQQTTITVTPSSASATSSSTGTTTTSSSTTTTPISGQNITELVAQLANSTEPNRYRLNVVYTLLQTNCGARIRSILEEGEQQNRTVFLPVDEAFGALSRLLGGGGLTLDCGRECKGNPFEVSAGDGGNMLQNVLACLPEMMAYHVVQNASVIFNTSNMTYVDSLRLEQQEEQQQITNVTVLETALNGTSALVDMEQNQVIIANSTSNGTYLNYGFQDPAQVISEPLNATDGTVYLINRFPLNATLLLANQTLFLNNSLQNGQQQNYSNVTLFVPLDQVICPDGQQDQCQVNLNATDYVIPQVLYANDTLLDSGIEVQNLNNQTLQVNMTQEFNITVNGTPVAIPNVPFAGGVIHFLNGTLSSATETATGSTATGGASATATTGTTGASRT